MGTEGGAMDKAKLALTAIIVAVAVSAAISVSRLAQDSRATQPITLTAAARSAADATFVDLHWTGAANGRFEIHRDAVRIATATDADTFPSSTGFA
jgi:hypothetical protein